jgi:hypothetical protein
MSLTRCPKCNAEIPEWDLTCPSCGFKVEPKEGSGQPRGTTLRDIINKQYLRTQIFCWLGLGIGLLSLGISWPEEIPVLLTHWVGYFGVGVFIMATFYAYFFVCCPKCGAGLATLFMRGGAFFKMPDDTTTCPFCKVSFDKGINE